MNLLLYKSLKISHASNTAIQLSSRFSHFFKEFAEPVNSLVNSTQKKY